MNDIIFGLLTVIFCLVELYKSLKKPEKLNIYGFLFFRIVVCTLSFIIIGNIF